MDENRIARISNRSKEMHGIIHGAFVVEDDEIQYSKAALAFATKDGVISAMRRA